MTAEHVFYQVRATTVRAKVLRRHRDGSVTVEALFFLSPEGKDVAPRLGFEIRLERDEILARPN
jgi:hypothetical protein